MTTSGVASDENFVKMAFPFHCFTFFVERCWIYDSDRYDLAFTLMRSSVHSLPWNDTLSIFCWLWVNNLLWHVKQFPSVYWRVPGYININASFDLWLAESKSWPTQEWTTMMVSDFILFGQRLTLICRTVIWPQMRAIGWCQLIFETIHTSHANAPLFLMTHLT